jgi:type IV pilus assembly protein PilC
VEGQRRASHRSDVEAYLRDRGYTRYRIMRRWLPVRHRPSSEEVVMFVRLCADLLREGIPLDAAIKLLQNEVRHPRLRGTLEEIVWGLREGKSGHEVFGAHQDVLGRFPAHMFAVASTSDNSAEVFESAAKFIERRQNFRRNVKSALLMPAITLIVLFAAVVFYVGYIFPEMAMMYERFDIPLPPMTKATLAVSGFAEAHTLYLLLIGAILIAIGIRSFLTYEGRLARDRWLLRLPIVGGLFQKASIEIWCRMFHALYSGSAGNIEAVRVASESCQNLHIERQIKSRSIPLMVKQGMGLVDALEKAHVFTQNALARLRAGEASGTLKRASLQVANYYEKDSTYRMRAFIDWIQVTVAILITVAMTVLTIISSETAVIQPEVPGIKSTPEITMP